MKPPKQELIPYQNDFPGAAKQFGVTERTIRRWMVSYELYQPKNNFGPGKLTKKQVQEIRVLYEADACTQAALAERFGVSQPTIGKIVNHISHKTGDLRFGSSAQATVNLHYDEDFKIRSDK